MGALCALNRHQPIHPLLLLRVPFPDTFLERDVCPCLLLNVSVRMSALQIESPQSGQRGVSVDKDA